MNYKEPRFDYIKRRFKDVGATEEQAEFYADHVLAMLWGARRPKTPRDTAATLKKLKTAVHKARSAYRLLDETTRGWLEKDIGEKLDHALKFAGFAEQAMPGGHAETENWQFATSLIHFLENEGLDKKLTISDKNPIVLLFSECTGLDPKTAKQCLHRIVSDKKRENNNNSSPTPS